MVLFCCVCNGVLMCFLGYVWVIILNIGKKVNYTKSKKYKLVIFKADMYYIIPAVCRWVFVHIFIAFLYDM